MLGCDECRKDGGRERVDCRERVRNPLEREGLSCHSPPHAFAYDKAPCVASSSDGTFDGIGMIAVVQIIDASLKVTLPDESPRNLRRCRTLSMMKLLSQDKTKMK